MKVLFLTSMYVKAGSVDAGYAVHRQALELRRQGIDVRVVCPVPRVRRDGGAFVGGSRSGILVDGVPVVYVPFWNAPLRYAPGTHVFFLRRAIWRELERGTSSFGFNILHVHRLFPTGSSALGIARRRGVPLVSSAVGSDVHTYPSWRSSIRREVVRTIRESDCVVSVSRALAKDVDELATPKLAKVVHRGVDTKRFAPSPSDLELRHRLGLPADGHGIVSVCRLMPEKGLFELLDAFEHVAKLFADVWLTIVGEGPSRAEFLRKARQRGLGDRVFLPGRRPQVEVGDWINAADIFVLASHREGLPNVVREAMSCGKPVVATDVGGVSEILVDRVTGLLVPAYEVAPLAEAIGHLIADAEVRKRYGESGRRQALSQFSWTRRTEELMNLYEEVLTLQSERRRQQHVPIP